MTNRGCLREGLDGSYGFVSGLMLENVAIKNIYLQEREVL